MLDLVEPEDVIENKSKRLTLDEKRAVADNVKDYSNEEYYGETFPGRLDVEPPDQNIKDMLSVIKGEAEQSKQPEGEISENVAHETISVIDINILKGLLHTIYMAPYFIYRTGKYKLPEIVSSSLDARASQLQMMIQLFGFLDPKYMILLVFGGGFAMDMAMLLGDARELGKDAKERREMEKRSEFAKMTEEQRMLKEGLGANKL